VTSRRFPPPWTADETERREASGSASLTLYAPQVLPELFCGLSNCRCSLAEVFWIHDGS
jgi:hypothetical protein